MGQFNTEFEQVDDLFFQKINHSYRQNESERVEIILQAVKPLEFLNEKIYRRAFELVQKVREKNAKKIGLDAFLLEYDLSTEEGIALMCLAEALLRIPDKASRDKLIKDKLLTGNWHAHSGKSASFFVNAATWGLLLTGKILKISSENSHQYLTTALKRLANKGGEPIVREVIVSAMKILGRQFVMARTINTAIKRAQKKEKKGYRYSYDMLGEAAFTASDAQKYFTAYRDAIIALAEHSALGPILGPGISVKLSALHPRFVISKRQRLQQELIPRLKELVTEAKKANIGLTVDAEEAHTLRINLDCIQSIIESPLLENWEGFGVAVQAYQKSAPDVIDFLVAKLRQFKKRMTLRLVKGAYWDSEIKTSQVQGLTDYPVFTRKITTDVNYLVCVQKCFAATDVLYPQFATHNALTLATVIELAKEAKVTHYEFQCLHGMGGALYNEVLSKEKIPCRIYAPVGTHEELLAYLVRRLLENGANSSFVNRILNEKLPIAEIIASPIEKLKSLEHKPHPKIPLPKDLFKPLILKPNDFSVSCQQNESPGVYEKCLTGLSERRQPHQKIIWEGYRENSQGVDLSNPCEFLPILKMLNTYTLSESICAVNFEQMKNMLEKAQTAFENRIANIVVERVNCLQKMAVLLHEHRMALYGLLVYEAGKTLDDAIAEVREAIDFCYYYAQGAKNICQKQILPGPTGELNTFSLHPRGIMVCISPWNFPLAIFLGQVVAALAVGNCVLAKPASQTLRIASLAIDLLHQAGIPLDAVQLLPVSGREVSKILVDERVQGIIFTGSTQTAQTINQQIATRKEIIPFIAETGGQNAMIVDSSALAEQVTQDVITSAFRSAGQRCSALRVLFVQEEVSDKILTMIKGAMAELKIGHPKEFSTDVGPVIDEKAQQQLLMHVENMQQKGTLLFEVPLPKECNEGAYFAPRLYAIDSLDILTEEVFGPILHVVRYKSSQLADVIGQINRTGFGLTLGIHSRIHSTIETICAKVKVGNCYVNRNMIGAVVGVQPFGGEGLSGTGPKAGGPYYLPRLCIERTVSVNTTASGGNTTLMSLSENEG